MVEDCPMTEECPAYDRDREMCLVHPGGCEFSHVGDEAGLTIETPQVHRPDTSTEVRSA